MSRSFMKLLVLFVLVVTLSALAASLAFADIESGEGAEPVATLPPVVFLSSSANGKIGDLKFNDEDIVVFVSDETAAAGSDAVNSGTWSIYFDGSDVGVGRADVDAFEFIDDSTVLMSFDRPVRIPGFDRVDDSDIVKFTYTAAPGDSTAGFFEMCLDGSEFDLTTGGEDIDAIAFDADGRLLISTTGTARVNGRDLKAYDEDLLAFGTTPFDCNPASGVWEIFLDGSDLRLTGGSEDVTGAWVDTSVPENNIYMSTKGNYRAEDGVNGIAGDRNDIFGFTPFTLGEDNTTGFLFAAFDGAAEGQSRPIDGVFVAPSAVSAAVRSAAAVADADDESVVQYEVEADDLADEDLSDAELDEYDSILDLTKLFMPVVMQR